MSSEHRRQITALAGCPPIWQEAADFGWVHRARLWWGSFDAASPPTQLHCTLRQDDVHVVRYTGPRVPANWTPEAPFRIQTRPSQATSCTAVQGADIRIAFGGHRFLTFTTCFPHPDDRPDRHSSTQVRNRWMQDGRRFPLYQYASENLVWNGSSWRHLLPAEKEELHGLPRGWTAALQDDDRRHSAIGNGWHLPSATLIVAWALHRSLPEHIEFYVATPSLPAPPLGTSPQPQHSISARRLLEEATGLFPSKFFKDEDVRSAAARIDKIPLDQLLMLSATHLADQRQLPVLTLMPYSTELGCISQSNNSNTGLDPSQPNRH